MIFLLPRKTSSNTWKILSPIMAILLMNICMFTIFSLMGLSAKNIMFNFYIMPLSSLWDISEILMLATPLLLIAIGLSSCYKAGIIYIGAEGQYIMGACSAMAMYMNFPNASAIIILPLMLIAAIIASFLWTVIVAYLKINFKCSEIIVGLMMVYIAEKSLIFLLSGPIKDTNGFNMLTSPYLSDNAILPTFGDTNLNMGFIIAILLSLFIGFIINKSFLGFQINVLGQSGKAAKYAGFSEKKVIWTVLIFSSICTALASFFYLCGPLRQISYSSLVSGYGFSAIIVSYLARNNHVALIPAAIFMAYLTIGGEMLKVEFGFPSAFIFAMQGLQLLLILVCNSLIDYKIYFRFAKEKYIKSNNRQITKKEKRA